MGMRHLPSQGWILWNIHILKGLQALTKAVADQVPYLLDSQYVKHFYSFQARLQIDWTGHSSQIVRKLREFIKFAAVKTFDIYTMEVAPFSTEAEQASVEAPPFSGESSAWLRQPKKTFC